MSPWHGLVYVVEYVLSGLLAGAASTAFGIGGAALSTPLIRLFGVPATLAVATTLPAILPGSLIGWLHYRRAGLIRYGAVLRAVPSGLVGAVVGSDLSQRVPGRGHLLMVATAAVIAWLAVRMLKAGLAAQERPVPRATGSVGEPRPDTTRARPARQHHTLSLVATGLLAGLLSGLLGLGGGIVLVPAFVELLGYPIKQATATSLVCVGCFALPSTITHGLLGDLDWTVALLLTAGTLLSARFGAQLALRASDGRLRMAMGVLLGVVALVYGGSELVAALGG